MPAWLIIDNDNNADEIDIKTIGQYTGLKDKNGKEIYEGDIVKYKDDSGEKQKGIVEYGYKFKAIAIEGDEEGNQDVELHPDYNFEIIGNIYENPDLLENEK